jgi:uncharacterized protein YdaU (DUF1376 family)
MSASRTTSATTGDALTGLHFMPLTLEERGAYQTLLDMMYDRGGPLIDNERLLAGYMNCSLRKWRQIRADLIEKGKISITRDGQICNSRARKEIENQSKTHRKLIESGAKGGRTRAENEKKSNENSETGQASLEPGSSDPQAIRARVRSQKPEARRSKNPQTPGAILDHDILPTMRRLREGASRAPFKLKFFDAAIRDKVAADAAEIERLKGISRRYQDEAAAAGGGR